ncbi:hypothetical protein [Shewanella subflava]|uniref:Uncharacterized protein n=1 Tax=Shewanella subflava TaxID=2986476 RepID=A0ABT3IC43_9GAMM|nr:hypothetical protein [Shewanella subflava]MCW3173628.1 hypothetical protein [Shewanella subflava]
MKIDVITWDDFSGQFIMLGINLTMLALLGAGELCVLNVVRDTNLLIGAVDLH